MKKDKWIWIGLIAVVWAVVLTCSVRAKLSPDFSNSKIVLQEGEPGDGGYWTTNEYQTTPVKPNHNVYRTRLRQRRALEEFVEFLSPLRLPFTLGVYASDCRGGREDSPHYSDYERAINMCYSFVGVAEDGLAKLAELQKTNTWWPPASPEQYLTGLYAGVLLHETGHALTDLLDLPVFGREEDMADQIAAYIALQFGKKDARQVVLGFAYLWSMFPDPTIMAGYADEHGSSSQRLYNTLCIAYGGDPGTFGDFVESGWLPPERAQRCADEYQQVDFAFKKTILPFIDQEQMGKVQARPWFLPSETREPPLN
jgi:putative metallopeptidase DUF4344